MLTDNNLQQAVMDELKWEPSVDAAHIGVAAKDGVVTLSGDVGNYAEKLAAQRAARRVYGVKGVAEEIKVRYPSSEVDDNDIAQKALQALSWDSEVPDDRVKVEVEECWVTLSGVVDWYFQRKAAEEDVRKLKGVVGVTNDITVTPRLSVQPPDLRDQIKAALKRNAAVEADRITIRTDGGIVTLSGKVRSWNEDSIVTDTVWSAPGVIAVEDNLVIA